MMRFIKQNLTTMDGVEIWPIISLAIFFLFFVGLSLYVWRMRKGHVEDMSRMPLTDDQDGPIKPRGAAALLLALISSPAFAQAEVAAEELIPGTHFGMSDDVWLIILLGGAVVWTAMILASMGIFRNLAEFTAKKNTLQISGVSSLLSIYVLSNSTFWGLVVANLFLMGYLVLMLRNVGILARDMRPKKEQAAEAVAETVEEREPSYWERIWALLNGHKEMKYEEDILLNHAYDGIHELDNRLPPWWLYGFYVSIFFGVLYLFNYHIFGYKPLSAEAYEISMQEAEEEVNAYLASMALNVDEHSVEYLLDDARITNGRSLFNKHCVACHAMDGGGGVGPNLTDAYWLHGGEIADVFKTVKYGVPAKGMRSWRTDLTPTEIQNVSTYILTLQGTTPLQPKDPQGDFAEPATPANAEGGAEVGAEGNPTAQL